MVNLPYIFYLFFLQSGVQQDSSGIPTWAIVLNFLLIAILPFWKSIVEWVREVGSRKAEMKMKQIDKQEQEQKTDKQRIRELENKVLKMQTAIQSITPLMRSILPQEYQHVIDSIESLADD